MLLFVLLFCALIFDRRSVVHLTCQVKQIFLATTVKCTGPCPLSESETGLISKSRACAYYEVSDSLIKVVVIKQRHKFKQRLLSPWRAEGSYRLLLLRSFHDHLLQRRWRRQSVGSGPVASHIITHKNHWRMVILIGNCDAQCLK